MRVAILGASDKPDRYSYKAFRMLREYGHEALPVHPRLESIEGVPVLRSVTEADDIDTITVYMRASRSDEIADDILAARPKRVIFNPGAENPALSERLRQAGIEALNACTLVMLRTGAF